MSSILDQGFKNHCVLSGRTWYANFDPQSVHVQADWHRRTQSHLSAQYFIINYTIQFILQFKFLDCTRVEMHPHTNALGQNYPSVTKDHNNDEGPQTRGGGGGSASQLIKSPTDFASPAPTDGEWQVLISTCLSCRRGRAHPKHSHTLHGSGNHPFG